MKSIANIAECGRVDGNGIIVLTSQDIRRLAGINRTMKNIARIALAFLSSDLSGDDLIEMTMWNDLNLIKNWKNCGHHPGWDTFHHKSVELHSLLVTNSISKTSNRINRFCQEVSRQLGRKVEFSGDTPYSTVFWR